LQQLNKINWKNSFQILNRWLSRNFRILIVKTIVSTIIEGSKERNERHNYYSNIIRTTWISAADRVYQESNGDERKLWRVECANELLIERPKAQGYHWQAKSESIYAHRTRTCVRIFLRNLSARATLNPFIGLLNVRNSSSLIICVISFTEIRDIEKSSVSLFFK